MKIYHKTNKMSKYCISPFKHVLFKIEEALNNICVLSVLTPFKSTALKSLSLTVSNLSS